MRHRLGIVAPSTAITLLLLAACSGPVGDVTPAQRTAIERTIRDEVTAAYDLSKPNVPANLMSLYAPTGRIVSASGGRVTTSRDSLRQGIDAFWNNVGVNMRNPRWEWTSMYIDVLAPNAAVMTATYRIPHIQPNGMQHVIGGAWTAAFQLRAGKWVIVQEHLSDNPMAR
jgi:hypothetical protein